MESNTPKSSYRLLGQSGDLLAGLAEEEAVVRIQGLLSQWLRMENVVALLGAGCSVTHGGALLGELEEHVLAKLLELSALTPAISDAVSLIRERSESLSAEDTLPFEHWLSSLVTSEQLLGLNSSPVSALSFEGWPVEYDAEKTCEKLTALIRGIELLVLLRCTLRLDQPLEPETGSAHQAFVAKLVARDPTLGRSHVFTTNYDTLIEQASDELRIRYSDGFVGGVNPVFDSSAYGLDLYYPGEVSEGRVQRFDKFYHFYKMHGSVEWSRRHDGRVQRISRPSLPSWTDWSAKDEANQSKEFSEIFANETERLAIFPTDGKHIETVGQPYAHLFRAFESRLQAPQTFLIIIGYGFGDEHINMLLDDALTNPSLVLLVVDPKPSEGMKDRITRYQATGERAFLLTGSESTGAPLRATFGDFAQNLMPHVQWLDDFLRLRKVERDLKRSRDSQS